MTQLDHTPGTLSRCYHAIQESPLHVVAAEKMIRWRDQAQGIGAVAGRRVLNGFGLAALGLEGLLDVIASLALGILALPLEFTGLEFARHFFKRAVFGTIASSIFLTTFQLTNIFYDKILLPNDL